MNNKQKLLTAISGLGNGIDVETTSAKDHYYYDNCETKADKIAHLDAYASNALELVMTNDEIEAVYNALETETTSQSEYHRLYASLD